MATGGLVTHREQGVAAFVTSELGSEVTRVIRLDAFAGNAVYQVDTGVGRFVVKASTKHAALRAEAWACARGAYAGCQAPALLGLGRLDNKLSALIMRLVAGSPIVPGHPVLAEVGARLRALHDVKLGGFGWLAEAVWDQGGGFSLTHGSWLGFLRGICADVRHLTDQYAIANSAASTAEAAIDAHADALGAIEVGSLCHGDLKAAHILAADGRLAGVIDWGDAVAADPLWDIARFAHRADAASVSLLLEGYGANQPQLDELAWRVRLYEGLWMLVDAVVAHHLGQAVEEAVKAAMGHLDNGGQRRTSKKPAE